MKNLYVYIYIYKKTHIPRKDINIPANKKSISIFYMVINIQIALQMKYFFPLLEIR